MHLEIEGVVIEYVDGATEHTRQSALEHEALHVAAGASVGRNPEALILLPFETSPEIETHWFGRVDWRNPPPGPLEICITALAPELSPTAGLPSGQDMLGIIQSHAHAEHIRAARAYLAENANAILAEAESIVGLFADGDYSVGVTFPPSPSRLPSARVHVTGMLARTDEPIGPGHSPRWHAPGLIEIQRGN